MRRFVLVLTLAALIPTALPLRADDIVLGRFGAYLESLRVQAGIPGMAAGIIGRSTMVWEWASGHQDIARRISTRTDTPFHLDGLTQVFTAALVLRCVEEGRLFLDDRVGQFDPSSLDPTATVSQVLTHTSAGPDGLTYGHQPERLTSLDAAVRRCSDDSYRETLGNLLDRLAMVDSVPGPDSIVIQPPAQGVPHPALAARYRGVIDRLATPYAVDQRGRVTPSQYSAVTLTPTSGLVSTVRDYAKFDLALKSGVLLREETLAAAWRAPAGRGAAPLPHGMGWFVQSYNGETIVWQFGMSENASSSLVVMLPARGVTLVLLANSHAIVAGNISALLGGDVTVLPFARLFLGLFGQ